jgi:hypothetical protein
VSGLHSSISAHIIQGIAEQQESGKKAPVMNNAEDEPLDADTEFAKRLLAVPTAVENLYFGYMLMLCAVREAAGRLEQTDYGTYCPPQLTHLCIVTRIRT